MQMTIGTLLIMNLVATFDTISLAVKFWDTTILHCILQRLNGITPLTESLKRTIYLQPDIPG